MHKRLSFKGNIYAWKIEMKGSILIDMGLVANVKSQVLPLAWRIFYGTLACC